MRWVRYDRFDRPVKQPETWMGRDARGRFQRMSDAPPPRLPLPARELARGPKPPLSRDARGRFCRGAAVNP